MAGISVSCAGLCINNLLHSLLTSHTTHSSKEVSFPLIRTSPDLEPACPASLSVPFLGSVLWRQLLQDLPLNHRTHGLTLCSPSSSSTWKLSFTEHTRKKEGWPLNAWLWLLLPRSVSAELASSLFSTSSPSTGVLSLSSILWWIHMFI